MMRLRLEVLMLLVFSQTPAWGDEQPVRDSSLALTHVTVIDVTKGTAMPDMTVVILGERIEALGDASQLRVPAGARVIDARGKFLIPGLWDMHVHIGVTKIPYDPYFPLLVANGVTGVRDMGGILPLGQFRLWRRQIAERRLLGPRLIMAGPIVDGPRPVRPWLSIAVTTPADGRFAVDAIARAGADFVKVYSEIPRDAYFAIADEAKGHAIPFVGHVPDSVTAVEASDAGQKSIEHLSGVALSFARNERTLRARLKRQLVDAVTPDASNRIHGEIDAEALDSYDPVRAAQVIAYFVKNGTWQCPTLVVLERRTQDQSVVTEDPHVKYMPSLRGPPTGQPNAASTRGGAQALATAKRRFLQELRLVADLHRSGVPILAGTDTPSSTCIPGFCLHKELALLARAGLTPLQVLQAATLNPARYLGQDQQLGTIDMGKMADLVILDANPLEDIRHTQTIRAVIVGGRLLDRATLDQMLARLEAPGN